MKKSLILFSVLLFFYSCSEKKSDSNLPFELLSNEQTGIDFKNQIIEDKTHNVFAYEYFYNGGGVGIGDINNDGLPDIYFTGNLVPNRLYLNKGDFKFQDITSSSGTHGNGGWSTGVTMVDINNDGFLDIYVCRSGYKNSEQRKNLLYINNGNLTFTESAEKYGIADTGYSTQATFFDYDKDGDLDLYVANHPLDFARPMDIKLRPKETVFAYSDRLYRNNGDGTFSDVTIQAGILNDAFALGIVVSDINNDGWPDIYVSNDYIEPDYLYINNKNGTFTESIKQYTKHISNFGMGVDIADFNNDSYTDVIVVDMTAEDNYRQKLLMGPMPYDKFYKSVELGYHYQYMRNCLQLNNGNNTFSEIAQLAGISNTDWSWCPLLTDFDNDGYKDLFITNGLKRDVSNMDFVKFTMDSAKRSGGVATFDPVEAIKLIPSTKITNYMFNNNGNLTFTNKTDEWGFQNESFSNGAAYADLDLDGDLDIVINNIDDKAFVYKNNLPPKNYLRIKLKGTDKNINGLGATVEIISDGVYQKLEQSPTRGYLSCTEPLLHFGVSKSTKVDKLKITWADGKSQMMNNVSANQVLILNYASSDLSEKIILQKEDLNYTFSDETSTFNIAFKHTEDNYNDFKNERLIPHKMSQEGPKVAVADVNNDGLEDFFVCGASGSSGKLFVQNKNGKFDESKSQPWQNHKDSEDEDALFFDTDNDGDVDLYIVSGGSRSDMLKENLQDRLYLNDGKGNFVFADVLPVMHSNKLCVTASDFDADGDLDLFVGGGVEAGRYPFSSRSYLLQNDKGKFTDVTAKYFLNENIGIIKSVVFADINKDSKPDLIAVGEWTKIQIFENSGSSFKVSSNDGLENSTGWWKTITVTDFDNDGDVDFIVGNQGLNSQMKPNKNEPVSVYANDYDNNGSLDAIVCYYIQGKSYPMYSRNMILEQMPFLNKKFLDYSTYAKATITDVLSAEQIEKSAKFIAEEFRTSLIENLGNVKFEIKPLPVETQFAPVYAIAVEDVNNDGIKDIIVAGNSYSPAIEMGRIDASTGFVLIGNKNKTFTPKYSNQIGFYADKNVKDLKKIKIGNAYYFIVANNNDAIQFIKFNPKF